MGLSSYLDELQKRHELLSKEVELAQQQPGYDDLEIGEMKKQKLKLKEQIEKFQHA